MLFNSFSFAVFFPIVFIVYWIIPDKYRWILMLVASYYFYMSWNPKYVVLILLTTVVSYASAIAIEKTRKIILKRLILINMLIICLGVLFIFKYFSFFMESLCGILSAFTITLSPVTLKLALPVGISFYTFQTLSYVIDVYRDEIKAEKHFGIYATFVSFFPQLVAGPIERTGNLLPQIEGRHKFDYDQAVYGLKLMVIGYYKKLVIADVVAQYVDLVYADIRAYQGFDLAVVIFFFSIQIYCDFSGYSDIAIGVSKLMGINLMTNFRSPYFARSIKEFWSKWHISLSTWFKDYVYIPLGGNRCSKSRNYLNLMITFLVSGLWHGADWTFVIWGGIHGFAQIVENILNKSLSRIREHKIGKWIATMVVFLFCNITWIFFRAEHLWQAAYIIRHVFDGIMLPRQYLQSGKLVGGLELGLIFGTIGLLAIYDYLNISGQAIERVCGWNKMVQWGLYVMIGIATLFLSQKGVAAEFVYFQF